MLLPANKEDKEDKDKQQLSWTRNKLKESKWKKIITDTGLQGTIFYSNRGSEQKLLANDMKTSKASTIKRRTLKKAVIVNAKNIEVVEVREEEDIDFDIIIEIKMKR